MKSSRPEFKNHFASRNAIRTDERNRVCSTVKIALLAAGFLVSALMLVSCTNQHKNSPKTETGPVSPEKPLKIASMAPSATSILAGLGLADSLVAIDSWSARIPGISGKIAQFDMMKPDVERIAAFAPDLLLVSTLTQAGTGKDPFEPLSAAGIKVVYLPTCATVADIGSSVMQIAALTGRTGEGSALVAKMNNAIKEIRDIAQKIPASKRRSVFFEIAPAPYIYSFGSGVYLDELIQDAGAVNALKGEKGWIAVNAETVLASDPDVILTNVDYLADPVAEICARPGWSSLKAVKNGRVFRIDNTSSSQPAPEVIKALREIAEAVYPEYFL